MMDINLGLNSDGACYVLMHYSKDDAEFSTDFDVMKSLRDNSQRIRIFIKNSAKKVEITGIKIILSGVVIATIPMSSFLSLSTSAADKYSVGYLYSGTDMQQIQFVNRTNGALGTVSPSYFDIEQDGSLKLNYLSEMLISSMHSQGIKVVPFLSNHWNRVAGINALNDVGKLSTDVANYVSEYNLDGVNVDIENVTQDQSESYTEFVRLLREKIPQEKEVSVAVAANPYNWQTGWHGSYDYEALAAYASHLFIMTYDEHYEGGGAGPVASIGFVEDSIKYALTKTNSEKIVVGVPLYGRVWGLDSDRIKGKGIKIQTVKEIIEHCDATITHDESSQSVKAEFEIKEGDPEFTVGGDFVLTPGRYVVWYEDERSYQAKLNLVSKYNLKGAGTWSLGQEDPSIWNRYGSWLNGSEIIENIDTAIPAEPETSTEKETVAEPETVEPETQIELETEEEREESSTVSPTLGEGSILYVVKNGDTLWKLAKKYLGSGSLYSLIKSLNGLSYDKIRVGQEIKIPVNKKVEYTVKKGDTLWGIAKKHLGSGTLYPEIKRINNLTSDTIYPGQVLKLSESSDISI